MGRSSSTSVNRKKKATKAAPSKRNKACPKPLRNQLRSGGCSDGYRLLDDDVYTTADGKVLQGVKGCCCSMGAVKKAVKVAVTAKDVPKAAVDSAEEKKLATESVKEGAAILQDKIRKDPPTKVELDVVAATQEELKKALAPELTQALKQQESAAPSTSSGIWQRIKSWGSYIWQKVTGWIDLIASHPIIISIVLSVLDTFSDQICQLAASMNPWAKTVYTNEREVNRSNLGNVFDKAHDITVGTIRMTATDVFNVLKMVRDNWVPAALEAVLRMVQPLVATGLGAMTFAWAGPFAPIVTTVLSQSLAPVISKVLKGMALATVGNRLAHSKFIADVLGKCHMVYKGTKLVTKDWINVLTFGFGGEKKEIVSAFLASRWKMHRRIHLATAHRRRSRPAYRRVRLV